MKKVIDIKTKEELKNITEENTHFDVALASHMDKVKKTIDELTEELEHYKSLAKKVFGKEGGNDVFSTETRISYLMNTEELEKLIGKDKVKELKNRKSEKTFVLGR